MKYKIAYIDESASWINIFYQAFKYDYEILRIQVDENCSLDAIFEQLFESELDAIVTDYLLEEEGDVSFNGNAIVERVRGYKPHFPIIMLTAHEPQAISHMDDVHIIYGKSIFDGESEDEFDLFKSKMKANIDNYYAKKLDNQKIIDRLILKRNNEGLTMSEEEKLSKELITQDEYEPEGKDLPTNLVQKESVTQLHSFVSEARNILEELKKLNNN